MNTGSYVNGQWYRPDSAKISKNVNPADTSDVIAEYPLATKADVRLAIDAATAAFPAWKKTPGPERGRVLWRAATTPGGVVPNPTFFDQLYTYAWFVTFTLSGAIYLALMRRRA